MSRLEGFDEAPFTHAGVTHSVFRSGTGPAVIVISEIPGITPRVAAFAKRVEAIGLTVALPSLFGEPGREASGGYALRSLVGACVSREFVAFALNRTSPVTTWLRALARSLHDDCGGPGVGVVGMCFTGGFALAMMVDPVVVAPVLSQPSLPFPIGRKRRRSLGLSDADLAAAKSNAEMGDVGVLGLRFTGDPAVPADRFVRLRAELGDRFIGVEIDSSKGNPYGNPRMAHSVLTEHNQDLPGHPTADALEQVLDLFRSRLKDGA